jgi:hypothetical protein
MRSVPRMTQQLRYGRVQPASSNGLSGLNFGCLRHDCFQKMYNLRVEPDAIVAWKSMAGWGKEEEG